jgi:N-acetylmuramoyl-L-alanine amidase
MRLYRLSDSGEPVRDIQDRLSAMGFACEPDPRGEFSEATRSAVIAFQRARGLTPDGVVGPETWRALYEAGYRLGDRLLYLRRPMLRGEDVSELQSRLNSLGFDAGKPDGIFGPDTERGVLDFQRNRGLAEDRVAGPEVITEIRLVSRGPIRAGRQLVREREWLRSLGAGLVGTRVLFDAASRTPDEAGRAWSAANAAAVDLQERGGIPLISRSADEVLPERVRARRSNRNAADLVISFELGVASENAVYYFSTPTAESEVGRRLAGHLSIRLGGIFEGRATPILRETRAPAVVIHRHDLDENLGRAVIQALEEFTSVPG